VMTSQPRQTALARSVWSMAGPVIPMGKNSSGSWSRQAALVRQSLLIAWPRFLKGVVAEVVSVAWASVYRDVDCCMAVYARCIPAAWSRCGRSRLPVQV
jgi:hypothetical protein